MFYSIIMMPRCILNLWEVYSMPPKRFYIYVFSRGSSWFRSCMNYDRLGLYRNCRCAANISQRRIIILPQLTGLTLLSQWQISRLPWPFVAVTDPAAVDETFPKFSGFSSEKSRPNDASEKRNFSFLPQKRTNDASAARKFSFLPQKRPNAASEARNF